MKKILLCLLATANGPLWAATPTINTSQAADIQLGQVNFDSSAKGVISASTMNTPRGVATDPTTGKVYVADQVNNRILRFASATALASGAAAERVIGQVDLNTKTANVAAAQDNLLSPSGLAFDAAGRLYVADTGHNRVLRYNSPSTATTDGILADFVLGQGGYGTSTATNLPGGMNGPSAVAISSVAGDRVWVADSKNNRVLLFQLTANTTNGANANLALGQTSPNQLTNAGTTATQMNSPEGLAADTNGNLWVSDTGNNRVLRFLAASITQSGVPADLALGQPSVNNAVLFPSSPTAANLFSPQGLALDVSGTEASLWVADRGQHRVLRYDDVYGTTIKSGMEASVVLGQPNFQSASYSTTRIGLNYPYAVSVDGLTTGVTPNSVWVADSENHRALRFDAHLPAIPAPAPPAISGGGSYKTKKSSLTVRGTASSGVPIVSVSYKGAKGGFRVARGTSAWSFKASLKRGKNRFTVFATDALGRASAPITISIKRN